MARMAKQSSGFAGAAGRVQTNNSLRDQFDAPPTDFNAADDEFFQPDPNFGQKFQARSKVGTAFDKTSFKPSEDEILESPAPMTR